MISNTACIVHISIWQEVTQVQALQLVSLFSFFHKEKLERIKSQIWKATIKITLG